MHKKSTGVRAVRAAALAAVLGAALGTAALAQFRPPPPGPPPPFGRPPGGPRFGGPGRGPRPSTAAGVPLAALTAGLKLSAAQQAKVAKIQQQFGRQRRALMPPPPGGRPGGGPPPDFGAMRGAWDRMRAQGRSADAGIAAVLNSSQKAALPGLLRTLDDLRLVGMPPATYGTLKLSGSQTARLTALARASQQNTRRAMDAARRSGDFGSVRASQRAERDRAASQAAAVLTPFQRGVVNGYKAAHPRPPFGGPGGPGGPGGFGPPPPLD